MNTVHGLQHRLLLPKFRWLFAAVMLLAGGTAMSIEKPKYEVVYTDGEVEYRQYEPYLVAETRITNASSYKAAGNEGFQRLFRYISGGNSSRAKIAMTAPVQQSSGEKIAMTAPVSQAENADGWAVAFMLPTRYTMETAPVPADQRVQIREIPGRLMAVKRFSSRWTEGNFARREADLLAVLSAEAIETVGKVERAAYNSPFTLPFMRRNEVMVQVDRLPATSPLPSGSSSTAAAY